MAKDFKMNFEVISNLRSVVGAEVVPLVICVVVLSADNRYDKERNNNLYFHICIHFACFILKSLLWEGSHDVIHITRSNFTGSTLWVHWIIKINIRHCGSKYARHYTMTSVINMRVRYSLINTTSWPFLYRACSPCNIVTTYQVQSLSEFKQYS